MRFTLPAILGVMARLALTVSGAGAAAAGIPAPAKPIPAQIPIIRSWGTAAGLPQNTVTAMVQTRDKYLWLGTRDGLARFDGMRFKLYGLEQGLPGVDVYSLFEDHRGVLWIGTYGSGLCCLRQGRVETIPTPSRQPGSDTIQCMQEDSAGRLWVGTGGGLRFCLNNQLVEYSAFNRLLHTPIRCLLRSRDGSTMWIATPTYGLMSYRDGRLEPCMGPPDHEKVVTQALFEDRQNRLWVSIGNGTVLCRTNNQWLTFNETNGLPFAYVTSLTQDSEGTIWAGSLDDGLYRLSGTNFNVLRKQDGLSADDIRSLYCDHEGDLWVGTRTGGLNRLRQPKLTVISSGQGLTNDFTRSAAQTPDGTIWVGTTGGSLYRGGLTGFEPFRPQPVVYFYANVDPVLAAPDGSLWWGGLGALLHWQNNRLTDCFTNEPWQQNVFITALQNDRHGGIWIGTAGGQLVHMQDGHFTEFPKPITRAPISTLAVQPDGSVWVGTVANGVNRIHEGNDAVYAITNGLSRKASIRTFYLDDAGTLWIGTAGSGLYCRRNGIITSFTAEQGLPPRTISQIVEDDNGCLWLGSSHGIFKVSKQELLDCADGKLGFVQARSFGMDDGMLAEECSGGFCPAGLKTQSGLICISTVKGLVFLNPNGLHDESPPPRVLLEEARFNGQAQAFTTNNAAADADETGELPPPRLVISPGAHDIELHYTAIEFSAPEKIGFRYKLDGVDNGWNETGSREVSSRRTAFYQHIPPGDYIFHVQACNADGVWNEHDTLLAVTAQPFFWEATWFRAATILILSGFFAGVVWLMLRRRYRQRLARLQTLNAIERERLRISKDMHDQVGGVLTQVSQLSDMGVHETENEALAKTRFERIGNRARVAVQALDEIVWATNPKNDNLASFAEYVSRYSDEFFEGTNIRCWQEVPTALPALPLRADIRHNVFLAVRETMNNALKHAHCTEVRLKMRLDEGEMTVEIEDNGAGFDPALTVPGGNGLDNIQTRLTECGGRSSLASAPGLGTRFRLTFPINQRKPEQPV